MASEYLPGTTFRRKQPVQDQGSASNFDLLTESDYQANKLVVDQPTEYLPGTTFKRRVEPFSVGPVAEPEREKKSGIIAALQKGWWDMNDRVRIAIEGIGGVDNIDPVYLTELITRHEQRQQDYVKSKSHQYVLDVFKRESDDITEAEGFASKAYQALDFTVKGIWAAVTNPTGTLEFTAEQAANSVIPMGLMIGGTLAGIPGGPIGMGIGARAGLFTGDVAVETGAGVIEALHKRDPNIFHGTQEQINAKVYAAVTDPSVARELYRKGLIKGSMIGAVDTLFLGFSKMPFTRPQRVLNKELAKSGLEFKTVAGRTKVLDEILKGNEAVEAAFKASTAVSVKRAGLKAVGIETLGEGIGEGLGGLAAFGETSAEEIGLEMLGAGGQSIVTATVAKVLAESSDRIKDARKASRDAQTRQVMRDGESEFDPGDLNEETIARMTGVSSSVQHKVSEEVQQVEDFIATMKASDGVDSLVAQLLTVRGYEDYRTALRAGIREGEERIGRDGETVDIYIPVTPEQREAIAAGGIPTRVLRGSLFERGVEPTAGQETLRVSVPVDSVIARGNWTKGQLLVAPNGMRYAEILPVEPTARAEVGLTLAERLETAATRVGREAAEPRVTEAVRAGELEEEAAASKTVVERNVREASKRAKNKLKQTKAPDDYKTRQDLKSALDRLKIKLFPGQRNKRVPMASALFNYREALADPTNESAVNDVLAPTGYRLVSKADGIHIVPIQKSTASLAQSNTGNQRVEENTIDDYLRLISEQPKKVPAKEAAQRKKAEGQQAKLRKEAEREKAREETKVERVRSAVENIEENYVTREGDVVTVDEEGLTEYVRKVKALEGWRTVDRNQLDAAVKRLMREQELSTKPTPRAPLKGRRTVFHGTIPTVGPLASLQKIFKRVGGRLRFHRTARSLIQTKGGKDALLGNIVGAYTEGKSGMMLEAGRREPLSILTLAPSADSNTIARVYALAIQYIYMRDSVAWIHPDNTLDIDAADTRIGAHIYLNKELNNVNEGRFIKQLRDMFGEDVEYNKIGATEYVILNNSLEKLQFARRFGRLKVKRNDIKKSEIFTARSETVQHNWSEDLAGEGIRNEIRTLGFGNILTYVDSRRSAYLELAEEVGAEEVDTIRAAVPEEPAEPVTAEHEILIEDTDVSLSLGKGKGKPRTIRGWKLFVLRKDGTLGPLFINRKQRVTVGEWMPAEAHPTKGFAFRPQWHATKIPKAPHLKVGQVGSQFRVWRRVELRGITPMDRPESQGGRWFLANELRVVPEKKGEEGISFSLGERKQTRIGAGKDTREKAGRTLDDLESSIPEIERVARTSVGERKTVGGGRYSDLDLKANGAGLGGVTQADINDIWNSAIEDTENSELARKIIDELNMAPRERSFWNDALKLPNRARYWYEISSEGFKDFLRLSDENVKRFIALIAATSPRADPIDSLRRGFGSLAQYLSGRPIDVDLTIPESVREAIEFGTLTGLKTGSFGGTMQYMLGLEKTAPLSTNDRQVASSFNVTGDDIAKNPILYETLSRFYINLRDKVNANLPEDVEPFETWQLQALGWVEERAVIGERTREQTDDYLSALFSTEEGRYKGIIPRLRDAGVIKENYITLKDINNPLIPLVMSGALSGYRTKQKFTLEVGSPLSEEQTKALELFQIALIHDPVAAKDYLSTFTSTLRKSARGKTSPFANLSTAILGKATSITRFQHPPSTSPFDYSGTYEGVVSPNLRIPLPLDMTHEQKQIFMAAIGKAWGQNAVAHSRFGAEGDTDTYTIFVDTVEDLGKDAGLFTRFANELPDGHELIIERWPNGYSLHVTPRWDEKGAHTVDKKAVDDAFDKVFPNYDGVIYSSKFVGDLIESTEYDIILSDFRKSLTATIRAPKKFLGRRSKDDIKDSNERRKFGVLEKQAAIARRRLDNFNSSVKQAESLQAEFEKNQAAWTAKYQERLRKKEAAVEEALSLTPQDKPTSGGLSASRVREILVERWGESGVSRLELLGILKIVDTASDLPVGLITDEDAAIRARGLYSPKRGTAYLIADRLNETTAHKVLLHEVGTHYGLRRLMGDDAYADLLMDVVAGKETIFKPWFDRVRNNYGERLVEDSNAFVEEVLAHLAEDTSDVTLSIRERIILAIRTWWTENFGRGSAKLSVKEVGHVIRGALQESMTGQLPKHMVTDIGEVRFGQRVIGFPEMNPTRSIERRHFMYVIASPTGKPLPRDEERKLRSNMNGMLKVVEKIGQKKYKDIDVHLPIVGDNNNITSRYAIIKNTRTGTELTVRVSNHPKTYFDAASSFPFVSFNSGHLQERVDFSDIEKAVKVLSEGKGEGVNALEFLFQHNFGDPVRRIGKAQVEKFTYQDFKRGLGKANKGELARIQNLETVELDSAAVINDSGPLFSISEEEALNKEVIDKAIGGGTRRNAAEWIGDAKSRWWSKRTQNWIDAYRPIKHLMGDQGTRAWMMMHLSDNSHGMLNAILHWGKPVEVIRDGKFDGYTVEKTGRGIVDVLTDLDGEVNQFLTWVMGNRSSELMAEGKEKHFTEDDIKTMVTLNKGVMPSGRNRALVYAQTMREISRLQDSLLDMAEKSGVITSELRSVLKTDFYVPFYREFDKEETTIRGPSPVHDFVNMKDVIHKMRGSDIAVHDVLHNMVMNWTSLMAASMKNRAAVEAMKAAVAAGVAKRLTGKESATAKFAKARGKRADWEKHVYTLEDGEKVWYEINDPLVLNSLTHLAWGGMNNSTLRTFSTFKRWFTIGVTASPAFKVRNLIRDTVHSIAVGNLSYNMFGNVAKGMDALRSNNIVTAEMMMGGATFHFGFWNDDPRALRRMANAGVNESRILDTHKKAKRVVTAIFQEYGDLGNKMENVNRAALYMQRREEVGHLQASFEARDLLNFASHGRGFASQVLTSMVPFLNARLQGLDKIARAGTSEQKGRLLAVVGTIVLASLLLRLSYEDDEEYEELEDWQKETYWPIKLPGEAGFFFLPKPFEIGAIASISEKFMEAKIRNFDDADFWNAWTSDYTRTRVMDIIMHQLAFDWRPQMVRPLQEIWTNKDAFLDRPIENLTWRMHNLPKDQRKRLYTSELAKMMSGGLGNVLAAVDADEGQLHLSPVQIDHLIRGYLGWIGAITTTAFDTVFIEPFLDKPIEPTKGISDMEWIGPIPFPLRSFFTRDPKNTKYLTIFYEQMREIDKYKSAYDAYKRAGMKEEARAVAREHEDVLKWRKMYTKINSQFSLINKKVGRIYDDTNLTGDQKRDQIDELYEKKVEMAKKLVFKRMEYEVPRIDEPSVQPGQLGSKSVIQGRGGG